MTDYGVTALFRRCHKLTVVDLSGCENFVGVSFNDSMTSQSDVDMDWNKTLRHLRRLTLGAYFTGSAKHSIAQRIIERSPGCLVDINDKKDFRGAEPALVN